MRRDKDLQADVIRELEWEPSVDSAGIGVAAKEGAITLTGHVSSYAAKVAADKAARRVYGVRAVADALLVELSSHVDERELDRLAFEAGRSYDFRTDALVRHLRGHRSMLRRYLTAHLNATQARTDQLPAATHALLEAYNDAWELLGEPAPKTMAESPDSSVTLSRLDPNNEPSLGLAHPALTDTEPLQQVHESFLTPSRS
jgi:transposase-like protein